MAAFADPDRQRRAPVALAGKAPVDDVIQEVAHAAFLDVVRHPVDGAVVAPSAASCTAVILMNQRAGGRNRSAAYRSASRTDNHASNYGAVNQQAALLQVCLQDHRVGLLDEDARPRGLLGQRSPARRPAARTACRISRPTRASSSPNAGALMDDAGAVGHGDVARPQTTYVEPSSPSTPRWKSNSGS